MILLHFIKLNSAIYSALEVSHAVSLGSVAEEECVGYRTNRNTCFECCCLKLCRSLLIQLCLLLSEERDHTVLLGEVNLLMCS